MKGLFENISNVLKFLIFSYFDAAFYLFLFFFCSLGANDKYIYHSLGTNAPHSSVNLLKVHCDICPIYAN